MIASMVAEEATMEPLMQQDQGGLVNVGVNRLHISSYYHPASTQRLLEAITIVVILDQELLKVHGVSLLILTLDGNIVMCQSVVRISMVIKVWVGKVEINKVVEILLYKIKDYT